MLLRCRISERIIYLNGIMKKKLHIYNCSINEREKEKRERKREKKTLACYIIESKKAATNTITHIFIVVVAQNYN